MVIERKTINASARLATKVAASYCECHRTRITAVSLTLFKMAQSPPLAAQNFCIWLNAATRNDTHIYIYTHMMEGLY